MWCVCDACGVIADGGVLLVCLDGRREAIFFFVYVGLFYYISYKWVCIKYLVMADLGWLDGSGQDFEVGGSTGGSGLGVFGSSSSVNMGSSARGVRMVAYTGSSVGSATSVLRCRVGQGSFPPMVVVVEGRAGASAGSLLSVVFRSPLFGVLGDGLVLRDGGSGAGLGAVDGSYWVLGGDGWRVNGYVIDGDSCRFEVESLGVNGGFGQGNSGSLRLVLRPEGCDGDYVGLSGVARFTQEGSEFGGFTAPRSREVTLVGGRSGGLAFDLSDAGYSGVRFRGLEIGATATGGDVTWGPLWGGLDVFDGLLGSVSVSGVEVQYGGDSASWVEVDDVARLYLDGGEVCCDVGLRVGYKGSTASFSGGVIDVRVSFEGEVQGVSGVSLGGVVCSLTLGANVATDVSSWTVNGVSATSGALELGYMVHSMAFGSLGGVPSSGVLGLVASRVVRRDYMTGGVSYGSVEDMSGVVSYGVRGAASGLMEVSGSELRRGVDRYAGDVMVSDGLELVYDGAVVSRFDVWVGGDGLSGGFQQAKGGIMYIMVGGTSSLYDDLELRLEVLGDGLVLPMSGGYVNCRGAWDGRVFSAEIWSLESQLKGALDADGAVLMDGGVGMPRSFVGGSGTLYCRHNGVVFDGGISGLFGESGGGVASWAMDDYYVEVN